MLTIADQFTLLFRERAKQPKPVPVGSHDERVASVLMLLDGRHWSTSDLAERMNVSTKSIQRVFSQLLKEKRVIQFYAQGIGWYALSNEELKRKRPCSSTSATAKTKQGQEVDQ